MVKGADLVFGYRSLSRLALEIGEPCSGDRLGIDSLSRDMLAQSSLHLSEGERRR